MSTSTKYTVQIPVFVTIDLTPENLSGHGIAQYALIDAAIAALNAVDLPANVSLIRHPNAADAAYAVWPA